MEEKIVKEGIKEMDLYLFLSPTLLEILKPGSAQSTQNILNMQKIIHKCVKQIQLTAPTAYYGKKNLGMDYSTGLYIGSNEIALDGYNKLKLFTRKECLETHKDEFLPEAREAMEKSGEKEILTREILGIGVELWVDDCYGRSSLITLSPHNGLEEDICGRASIFRRDPVDVLKNLPQNRKQYDFIHALNDGDLMHILKSTDRFDEVIIESKSYEDLVGKSYEDLVGKLIVALNEAQTA